MGTKWSNVSISGYGSFSPSDNGAETEANKVKYTTIKTDLTNPLNAALGTALSQLTELFDEGPKTKSGTYTTVASDNAKTIECSSTFDLTLLDPSTAGAGYKVRAKNAGSGLITVIGTIDALPYYILRPRQSATFEVNAAANAYFTHGRKEGVIQVVEATPYTSRTDISTQIPTDDSIPQSGEGIEICSQSITPTSTSSRIEVLFTCSGAIGSAGSVVASLFKDSGTSAVAVTVAGGSAGAQQNLVLRYEAEAGGIAAITFAARVGPNSAATNFYINGNSSGRLFGGVSAARMTIREIAA